MLYLVTQNNIQEENALNSKLMKWRVITSICCQINTNLFLSAQMTISLGKSVINLCSIVACSALGVGNQRDLSDDLECDPFLNTAMQRLTCDLYYRFGAFLAPVSIDIITGKHYAKNSVTK